MITQQAAFGACRSRKNRIFTLFTGGAILALLYVCLLAAQLEHLANDSAHLGTTQLVRSPQAAEASRQQQRQQQKQNSVPRSQNSRKYADLGLAQIVESIVQACEVQYKRGLQVNPPTLTAYLEPPLQDAIPGTGNISQNVPPTYIEPLPMRTITPDDLVQVTYPQLKTCSDMPIKLPIDRGLVIDPSSGARVEWNLFAPDQRPTDPASVCPVDVDPFLPWIHDVITSGDGSAVTFIAQNKRRCNSLNTTFAETMQPQVALFQSVSIQRISQSMAHKLAPKLWRPRANQSPKTAIGGSSLSATQHYRLATYEESDSDAKYTRFICQFHLANYTDSSQVSSPTRAPGRILVGETLSTYDFNYEYIVWRKMHKELHKPQGRDNGKYYTSTLQFSCPVPKMLQSLVASGKHVLDEHDVPVLFVDVVPIRTSPRQAQEFYLNSDLIGPMYMKRSQGNLFDASRRWGKQHVVPRVEASGRWANIPVCKAPTYTTLPATASGGEQPPLQQQRQVSKKHFLSACLWAATSFHDPTRVDGGAHITDSERRLQEWIDFHLMVGFDHIYLYDNSAANSPTNQSFANLVSRYSPDHITRIDWPALECNNNPPADQGYSHEGSSQYAAENSCRVRYSPFSEWMAHIDIDEYLVPMGRYTSLKHVLQDVSRRHGTKILNFRSIPGKLRYDMTDPVGTGRRQKANTTFLQAYNCDFHPLPKPALPGDRAKKQVYQASYMRAHFVHYTLVTEEMKRAYKDVGTKFVRQFASDPAEHFVDELTEATLVHAKTLPVQQSVAYTNVCNYRSIYGVELCPVGFPWPNKTSDDLTTKAKEPDDRATIKAGHEHPHNRFDMRYNCFINSRIENFWVPKLTKELQRREKDIAG